MIVIQIYLYRAVGAVCGPDDIGVTLIDIVFMHALAGKNIVGHGKSLQIHQLTIHSQIRFSVFAVDNNRHLASGGCSPGNCFLLLFAKELFNINRRNFPFLFAQ